MKINYFTAIVLVALLFSTCNEVSFNERDDILSKAFIEINSQNDAEVIKGLQTIKKYPTHTGLHKTIALWETAVSDVVEKEIIKTLKAFETFQKDPSLIKEIFDKNYDINSSKNKKLKLINLIKNTDVSIKDKLIKKIHEEWKASSK